MQKQPKALSIFFLTEMWERYGFYVIQTLLILYLIQVFHLSDEAGYGVLGSFTALAYGNSVIGGIVADRWLGHRTAVLVAAVMLSIGYSLVAVASQLDLSYWAFALITMGTGLLKPNIGGLLGTLYEARDVRRHSGFTYFYVGVNLGIVLGETLAGWIQRYFGWHSVFFSASWVLLLALAVFWWGSRHYQLKDQAMTGSVCRRWLMAAVVMVAAIGLSDYVISHAEAALVFFGAAAIASIVMVIYEAYLNGDGLRRRLIAFLVLVGISTLFWAMYFQMFFSMNLFVDRVVDRQVWGINLVPATYPAIEALAVIVIGPLLGCLWLWLESSKPRLNPSIPMKFALALLVQAIAFGILYLGSLQIEANGLVKPSYLVVPYVLIALGELLVMPVGLAMVSEWLPERLTGSMMGIFFISLGLGGKLAGLLADWVAIPDADLTHRAVMEGIYQHGFLSYFLVATVVTGLCFGLVPVLKKLIAPRGGMEIR